MAVFVSRSGGQIMLSNETRSVRFDARNLDFVRSALQRFVQTGGGMRTEESGHGETLVTKGGGTDAEPKVWISSEAEDRTSQGSLWLNKADAREALRTL